MKTRKNIKNIKNKTYSEIDYQSNDGMLTTVWGPARWHYLHTMSFNYPVNPTKQDKIHYMNEIKNMQYTLPCGKCRNNFKNNLKKLPIHMLDMESRHTFSKYVYDLHELVNNMLGKKSGLSYEDVRERYEHFRSRCTKSKKEIIKVIKTLKKKENGCTEPLFGEKSKCVLHIVPQKKKCDSFKIDKMCVKHR